MQAWQEEVERARQGQRDAEAKLSSMEASLLWFVFSFSKNIVLVVFSNWRREASMIMIDTSDILVAYRLLSLAFSLYNDLS